MPHAVICIEGLSKRYRLGVREPYGLLSESLGRALSRPFRRLLGIPPAPAPQTAPAGGPEWIWALRDVSFEVGPGEVIGIVGRNGAGKSTLLKILSRITAPTAGQVRMDGRVSSLLEVGTGFHPELTGRENVYLNGAILGMSRRETGAKFDRIVEYAEIAPFIDTPVKFYSSGMKVRLGFAVAAHLDSEILIVDEVLSVGDLAFRQKSFETIERMSETGRTILFVTHNVSVLEQLSARCVYLHEGGVRADGSTEEVLALYRRDLFGAAPTDIDDVPMIYRRAVPDPLVAIEDMAFCGADGQPADSVPAGAPAALSFDLAAAGDVEGADVHVVFFRERLALRSDRGHDHLGPLSVKKGERRRIEIAYPALTLGPGEATAVVFVVPRPGAPPDQAISPFHLLRLTIRRGDQRGRGLVALPQSWRVDQAPGLARRQFPAAE